MTGFVQLERVYKVLLEGAQMEIRLENIQAARNIFQVGFQFALVLYGNDLTLPPAPPPPYSSFSYLQM